MASQPKAPESVSAEQDGSSIIVRFAPYTDEYAGQGGPMDLGYPWVVQGGRYEVAHQDGVLLVSGKVDAAALAKGEVTVDKVGKALMDEVKGVKIEALSGKTTTLDVVLVVTAGQKAGDGEPGYSSRSTPVPVVYVPEGKKDGAGKPPAKPEKPAWPGKPEKPTIPEKPTGIPKPPKPEPV